MPNSNTLENGLNTKNLIKVITPSLTEGSTTLTLLTKFQDLQHKKMKKPNSKHGYINSNKNTVSSLSMMQDTDSDIMIRQDTKVLKLTSSFLCISPSNPSQLMNLRQIRLKSLMTLIGMNADTMATIIEHITVHQTKSMDTKMPILISKHTMKLNNKSNSA